MVESKTFHSQDLPFKVKMAGLKTDEDPITHISDISHEFYNYEPMAKTDLGDVISVKFDDTDSFIGASYTSGILRVFNSFSGKVSHTLNFNEGHDTHTKGTIVANSFKFRHNVGTERDIILTVNTQGKL